MKFTFYPFSVLLGYCLLLGCSEPSPSSISSSNNQHSSRPTPDIQNPNNTQIYAGMGIMVGEVTDASAFVQVRLTTSDKLQAGDVKGTEGIVKFELKTENSIDQKNLPVLVQKIKTTEQFDYIARAAFDGLKPGTDYICSTQIGRSAEKMQPGPTATFKTHPGKNAAGTAHFVVVTGMNYAKFHGDERINRKIHLEFNNIALPKPYAGKDKHLGYPALKSILALKPDFFVGTGDNVYYDTPREPRAQKVPELRQKWHEQFVQPRFRDLFSKVPTYWEIDDHDYRIDDGDNTGEHEPSPELGRQMMLEQLPVAAHDDKKAKTYRTHRITRDLQIWFVENRMYRSPNAMQDGPEKSIWGVEQKKWLKKSLKDSDATFKILISPNPMIGPDDARKFDNHCNINGFQHERNEFFNWLKSTGVTEQHFYIVCGDRHWQYHSIHPSGVEEFSCGALVDANARNGRTPGDPKSTDPDKTIKQPYSQKEPSGGFLYVKAVPATKDLSAKLHFRFHDEQGNLLHEETKLAKSSVK